MFFMIDGSFHGRVLHSVDVDVSYLVSSGTSVNVYFLSSFSVFPLHLRHLRRVTYRNTTMHQTFASCRKSNENTRFSLTISFFGGTVSAVGLTRTSMKGRPVRSRSFSRGRNTWAVSSPI